MKLSQAISWLMGGLQRSLFPHLEDCWRTPLSEKEQGLVAILELIRIEKYVLRSASNQVMGRKLSERESIARSFVAKAVYGYRFTRSLLEALKTTPTLRRICGFERVSDIPSTEYFFFSEFAVASFGRSFFERKWINWPIMVTIMRCYKLRQRCPFRCTRPSCPASTRNETWSKAWARAWLFPGDSGCSWVPWPRGAPA